MNIFSQELLEIVDKKQRETTAFLAEEGLALLKIHNEETVDINPLTEIPEPQMKLYGFGNSNTGVFFDTEAELIEHLKNNKFQSLGYAFIVEFMGNMAGRKDVIRRTDKDGESTLLIATTEDHIGYYNEHRSFSEGRFVWEGGPGDLKVIHSAFRELGIVFEDDIYAKEKENDRILREKLEKDGLLQPWQKKYK